MSLPAQDTPRRCCGRPSRGLSPPSHRQRRAKFSRSAVPGVRRAPGQARRARHDLPGPPPAGRARAAPAATISAFAALSHGGPAARLRPRRESRAAPAGPGAGRAPAAPLQSGSASAGAARPRRHGRSRAGCHRLRRGRGAAALPHRAEVRPAGAGTAAREGGKDGRKGGGGGGGREAGHGGMRPAAAGRRHAGPGPARCGRAAGPLPESPGRARPRPRAAARAGPSWGERLEARTPQKPRNGFVCRDEHPRSAPTPPGNAAGAFCAREWLCVPGRASQRCPSPLPAPCPASLRQGKRRSCSCGWLVWGKGWIAGEQVCKYHSC